MVASASGRPSSALAVAASASAAVAAIGSYVLWRRHRNHRCDGRPDQDQDQGHGQGHEHGDNDDVDADEDATFVRDESGIPHNISSNTANVGDNEEHFGQNLRCDLRPLQSAGTITVAYASTTGTCHTLGVQVVEHLERLLREKGGKEGGDDGKGVKVQLCRVDELDWWDEVLNPPDDDDSSSFASSTTSPPPIVLFVLPTWTSGTLPPQFQPLLTSLEEIATDWRVSPNPLRRVASSSATSSSSTGGKTSSSTSGRGKGINTSNTNKGNNQTLSVASFGIGSSAYDPSTYCKPALQVVELLCDQLGGRKLLGNKKSVGRGDVESGDYRVEFEKWLENVGVAVRRMYGNGKEKGGCCGGGNNGLGKISEEEEEEEEVGCCGGGNGGDAEADDDDNVCACKQSGKAAAADPGAVHEVCDDNADDDDDEDDEEEDDSYYSDDEENQEPGIIDLEDMGEAMRESSTATASAGRSKNKGPPKEMVTPKQAAALKKEGYRLIGTHSAVKLCRWTKHQLRGRGGCYKHTFYGITSYQCMEATPSLACANKCVFCWRHHKNPVGREWRWKTDDPRYIVDEGVKTHVQMIKETKGIPGVRMDRWEEAHTVRHCALSLVGEPIMYPRIDEFLAELHHRHISTFLVTNGQHPDAIETLRPITQLYVSVDAPTPESLEAIDRPLFKDAWDRLRRSLRCLKDKGQRTVARLTVVKGWNSDEVEGYANLIALGHCSLVEMKGVTFCGKSDASNLNMSNTPWHHEVVDLATKLRDELNRMHEAGGDDAPPRYEFACEHKHSVSVLLARVDQFAYDDPETGERKWKTWIDYDKFQELAAKAAADPDFSFGVEDYTAEAPSWALFGANEEGFDPTDTRHRKKKKHPKYTQFDKDGVPTHDDAGNAIPEKERAKLRGMMDQKIKEVGAGSTVTALTSGEKLISDPSLMFRGKTITK